jgi:hypothetical protein
MTPRRWTVVTMLALLAAGAACEDSEGPKPGPPMLVAFDVIDPSGMPVALAADGGPVLVPPRAHVVARFDRLLDGDRLESATDGGVTGNAGIAAFSGPGQPQAAIQYIPNGDADFKLLFAPGPQLVITPVPSLPAGATITVTLAPAQIVSKRGEGPFVRADGVPESLTFTTAPFMATITAADGGSPDGGGPLPLAADAPVTVVFNNLPETAIGARISVAVTDAAGLPLADAASPPAPSDMDPATWTVLPKSGAWPAGAAVTVAVDAAAKDALGMPIAAAATAAFAVSP